MLVVAEEGKTSRVSALDGRTDAEKTQGNLGSEARDQEGDKEEQGAEAPFDDRGWDFVHGIMSAMSRRLVTLGGSPLRRSSFPSRAERVSRGGHMLETQTREGKAKRGAKRFGERLTVTK